MHKKNKKKNHKYKIDFPSLVFLKRIGKQDRVRSGSAASFFLLSGWHLSSDKSDAFFFFFFFLLDEVKMKD